MRKRILYIILGLLVALFIILNSFSGVFSDTLEDFTLSYGIEGVIPTMQD